MELVIDLKQTMEGSAGDTFGTSIAITNIPSTGTYYLAVGAPTNSYTGNVYGGVGIYTSTSLDSDFFL